MLLGVVSDTHNNLKNINNIITIFNDEEVDVVIHTGDITNSLSISKFSRLNCPLIGVYGNNDLGEAGLKETIAQNHFDFDRPPKVICLEKKNIAIFHEPEEIEKFVQSNEQIDLVLHGHTHRYRCEYINKTIVFNPGESAGMFEGSNAIATVDLDTLAIKRIFF